MRIDAGFQTELLPGLATAVEKRKLVVLDERQRGTWFVEHGVRSIINPPESTRMGFWSINPYIGCEFGCTYCYARDTHRYVVERARDNGQIDSTRFSLFQSGGGHEAFERRIFVKQRQSVIKALNRDLKKIYARKLFDQQYPVVIGTATDPYQPAERIFEVTRAILETLATRRGLAVGIITKSGLITRDIDLLVSLSALHRVTVYISLISTDKRVIKLFEARSPTPEVRFNALQKLSSAGINAGLIIAPVLPGVTDGEGEVERIMSRAGQSGAKFAFPSPLRLYEGVRPCFMPVLEREYPDLAERYRVAYGDSMGAPRRYINRIRRRFERAARRHGLSPKDVMLSESPPRNTKPQQLRLWTR